MNKIEQSEELNPGSSPLDRQLRRGVLDRAISVLAENFKGNVAGYIGERELLKRISESGGEISGRTSIIMEKVLTDYVRKLRSEIAELTRRIESGRGVNIEEAGEEIKEKEDLIEMVEGNCLNSLGKINDSVLFPGKK